MSKMWFTLVYIAFCWKVARAVCAPNLSCLPSPWPPLRVATVDSVTVPFSWGTLSSKPIRSFSGAGSMACLPVREFGFTGEKTETNMQPQAGKCNMQIWMESMHFLLQLDSRTMRSSHGAQCAAFKCQCAFGTWSITLLAPLSEPHINYLPQTPELQHQVRTFYLKGHDRTCSKG